MKSQNSKLICLVISFIIAASVANAQTLYPLTKNLFVKIEGKYPPGYQPKWRLIGSPQNQELTFEQYVNRIGGASQKKVQLGIVEYQDKTVLRFRALSACECVADLELPNEKLIIGQNPIKIELSGFRKVQQGELDNPNAPCQNMAAQTQGGWKGYAILSADDEGNLTMSLRLENYASPRYRNGALMYTWFGNNISISNLMTPNNAATTAVAKENAEKENQRQAEIYARKQEERKKLNMQYEKQIKLVKQRPDANVPTLTTYKGYALTKVISLEKLVGKNVSNKEGVADAYEIAKDGYYSLLGGFNFTFKPGDYEPHERDENFALTYSLVKAMNKYAIDIATYALIGDIEKLNEAGNFLKRVESTSQIVDVDEQSKIKGYLKSKD